MITNKDMYTKSASEYIKLKEKNNLLMQEMLSNYTYITWLENFTLNHTHFFNDDWSYVPERISKMDNEKVNEIHLLYKGIDDYAINNNINPTRYNYMNYYKIMYNDIGFEIGKLTKGEILYFCNRVQISNINEFIDFNDIISSNTSNLNYTKKLLRNK